MLHQSRVEECVLVLVLLKEDDCLPDPADGPPLCNLRDALGLFKIVLSEIADSLVPQMFLLLRQFEQYLVGTFEGVFELLDSDLFASGGVLEKAL